MTLVRSPCLVAPLLVALILGGLLIGFAPVGEDPDTMYRPFKVQLAGALRGGRLPYWSDLYGLGAPLVAESHVAAFYPPNWVFYRLFDVPTAYRLLMWLHYVALAAATYLLARDLGISAWGSALSATSFTLCGFMAAHACHEPFYTELPYLPLALWAARRYVATGQRAWQAALALTLGVQLTLGHFQIQCWTMVLVLLTGAVGGWYGRKARARVLGVLGAVAWGLAVAAVQLVPTAEYLQQAEFQRQDAERANYALPPSLLAQPAVPLLFSGVGRWDSETDYWGVLKSSPGETCWYVGTVPLILAAVGFAVPGRTRGLRLWKVIIPVCLALACLPLLSPWLYHYVLGVPVLGQFRAPARYTLLASLGLCLLAGSGFERATPPSRFWSGLVLAVLFGVGSFAWGVLWVRRHGVGTSAEQSAVVLSLVTAAAAWGVGLASLAAWRWGRVGPVGPLLLTAAELGLLFYRAPTQWDWEARWPLSESPVMRCLAGEKGVGLIAGFEANNLPIFGGYAPAVPYLGIYLPTPNYLLWPLGRVKPGLDPEYARWGRRFGVTHGIYRAWTRPYPGAEVLLVTKDPVLDRLSAPILTLHKDATDTRWRVERYPGAFPEARVVVRSEVGDWPDLFSKLTHEDERDAVWYLRGEEPRDGPTPRATRAVLKSWDGREAVVEHDGECDLVVRRGYYPGWKVQVGDRFEGPVGRADAGLQAVRVRGQGVSRVRFRYSPSYWFGTACLSLLAVSSGLAVLGRSAREAWGRGPALASREGQ